MEKRFRDSLIAIGFGVILTMGLALKNNGGIEALKTGVFWKEMGFTLLLATLLTLIVYIFMARKKSLNQDNKGGKNSKNSSTGDRMVKRPKSKKSGNKKNKGKKGKK